MSKDDTAILNLSDKRVKRLVIDAIKRADGLHWFVLRRCRAQRSLAQNAYLWGVVYKHVQAGIAEAWGENLALEEIHDYCKKRFADTPIVNRETGEIVDTRPGSTKTMDTKECSEFIERIIQWSDEYLNTKIPPASTYQVNK